MTKIRVLQHFLEVFLDGILIAFFSIRLFPSIDILNLQCPFRNVLLAINVNIEEKWQMSSSVLVNAIKVPQIFRMKVVFSTDLFYEHGKYLPIRSIPREMACLSGGLNKRLKLKQTSFKICNFDKKKL